MSPWVLIKATYCGCLQIIIVKWQIKRLKKKVVCEICQQFFSENHGRSKQSPAVHFISIDIMISLKGWCSTIIAALFPPSQFLTDNWIKSGFMIIKELWCDNACSENIALLRSKHFRDIVCQWLWQGDSYVAVQIQQSITVMAVGGDIVELFQLVYCCISPTIPH